MSTPSAHIEPETPEPRITSSASSGVESYFGDVPPNAPSWPTQVATNADVEVLDFEISSYISLDTSRNEIDDEVVLESSARESLPSNRPTSNAGSSDGSSLHSHSRSRSRSGHDWVDFVEGIMPETRNVTIVSGLDGVNYTTPHRGRQDLDEIQTDPSSQGSDSWSEIGRFNDSDPPLRGSDSGYSNHAKYSSNSHSSERRPQHNRRGSERRKLRFEQSSSASDEARRRPNRSTASRASSSRSHRRRTPPPSGPPPSGYQNIAQTSSVQSAPGGYPPSAVYAPYPLPYGTNPFSPASVPTPSYASDVAGNTPMIYSPYTMPPMSAPASLTYGSLPPQPPAVSLPAPPPYPYSDPIVQPQSQPQVEGISGSNFLSDIAIPSKYKRFDSITPRPVRGATRRNVLTTPLSSPHIPKLDYLAIRKSQWLLEEDMTSSRVDLEISKSSTGFAEMDWYHICKDSMVFSDFYDVVHGLSTLTKDEKKSVNDFLDRISTENGLCRLIDPSMTSICKTRLLTRAFNQPALAVAFTSVPFVLQHSLEEKSQSTIPSVKPLLQAGYDSVPTDREREQVIARMAHNDLKKVLHVSRLWTLCIGNDCLITCSILPYTQMLPPRAKLVQLPTPSKTVRSSTIRVSEASGRRWMVPADACISWASFWAGFAQKFSDVEISQLAISTGFEHLTSQNWADVMRSDKPTSRELRIFRDSTRRNKYQKNLSEDIEASKRPANTSHTYDRRSTTATRGRDSRSSGSSSEEETVKTLTERDLSTKTTRIAKSDMTAEAIQQSSLSYTEEDDHYVIDELLRGRQIRKLRATNTLLNAKPKIEQEPLLKVFKRIDSVSDEFNLWTVASDAHDWLMNAPHRVRIMYTSCARASQSDISASLMSPEVRDYQSQNYNDLLKLMMQAKYMFSFFWPLDMEHIMASRFWYTIRRLVYRFERGLTSAEGIRYHDTIALLRQVTIAFEEILVKMMLPITQALAPTQINFTPAVSKLLEAWLKLFTGLLLLSSLDHADNEYAYTSFGDCKSLILAAETNLIENIRAVDAHEWEFCEAFGLSALFIERLIRDQVANELQISDVYRRYLDSLEPRLRRKPNDSRLLKLLDHYEDELKVIIQVVSSQKSLVEDFDKEVLPRRDAISQVLNHEWPLLSLIDGLLHKTSDRSKEFRDLRQRSGAIRKECATAVSDQKSMQEAAIYIFTVVTVIFLPLSFVASIFGMNTQDVRNLKTGQWVYWVSAIPLTIAVVLGSMWWSGQLGQVVAWFGRQKYQGSTNLTGLHFDRRKDRPGDPAPTRNIFPTEKEEMHRIVNEPQPRYAYGNQYLKNNAINSEKAAHMFTGPPQYNQ